MLEESKSFHDSRLHEAKQEYQLAKSHIPDNVDLRSINAKFERSTTPPLPPVSEKPVYQSVATTTPPLPPGPAPTFAAPFSIPAPPTKSSEFDIPLPSDNYNNRSSLDRRLSEFMKTFPNLTQAGMAPVNSADAIKPPAPGYYTQQPPPPPPPSMSTAPPSMDLLRFPPPNMMPPTHGMPIQPPSMMHHPQINQHQENHDPADMDLSDNEDSTGGAVLPMIASAMQQGAGGKTQPQGFVAGQQQQQFSTNPIQYAPRLNALPFDPSIMDPSLGGSPSSSSSRDRYGGDKSSHRYSTSSGGSSSGKHGSGKKYSSSSSSTSSHSSNRGKTRR